MMQSIEKLRSPLKWHFIFMSKIIYFILYLCYGVFLILLLLALSLLCFRADFSRLLSHFYPIPWRPFRVASKPFPAPWDLHCYTTQKLIIQPHSDFKMDKGTNFSFPLLEIHRKLAFEYNGGFGMVVENNYWLPALDTCILSNYWQMEIICAGPKISPNKHLKHWQFMAIIFLNTGLSKCPLEDSWRDRKEDL